MAPSTDPDAIKMEQALEEDRLETVAAIKELAKQKSDPQPEHTEQLHSSQMSGSSTQVQNTPNSSRPNTPSSSDQATALFVEERRKSSIEPNEAVRRGLSFGPLLKKGTRHNSTMGILKTSSKSPSSRLSQRAMSASEPGRDELRKDYFPKNEKARRSSEAAAQDSDDDQQAWSSGDEGSRDRGRKRLVEDQASPLESPGVTITAPDEEPRTTSKRFVVKPMTNYDRTTSRGSRRAISPNSSDSEELREIRRAQNLAINSSAVDSSVPHRAIQTIIRGNFGQLQQEAAQKIEGACTMRTYLVASDLSPQAAFALEWTIGTVLRDGDTLIVVYAVNEDSGTGVPEDCLLVGEGGKAMQENAAVVEKLTAASTKPTFISGLSNFLPGSRKSSAATSTDSRALSKAQQERLHALQRLSETCIQYLRKTTLQVRLAIEVISCRDPKKLLTEAIDALSPTLVIVGSRGRSSLKGVLLGSFSNYMVLKSSAPVMVARKRLEGRKAKAPIVRLANNLMPSKHLAEARID